MLEQEFFSEARYQKNISTYAKQVKEASEKIQNADSKRLKAVQSRDGSWNLKDTLANGEELLLLSPLSPIKEAKHWRSQLKLRNTHVLFIYGVGLGYYFDEIEEWLDESPEHFAVFLEDNLEVLRYFFHTERAEKLLGHGRVQLHYFSDIDSAFSLLEWLAWYFLMARIDVTGLESYTRYKEPVYFTLRLRVSHEMVRIGSLSKEYLQYGRTFYRNYYRNILMLPESYHGTQLFGKFKGIPAIICGAGPSLNKNGHLLKELKDKALIFAGGSSTNALSHFGVEPDFGATIDPNPTQRERMASHELFKTPFFYRNRVFHTALRTLQGPCLYLNGTGGYAISNWIEEKLGIKDTIIDEGHNVINFATEIAYHMGCNPIIFVGMDLAYTDDASYSSGIKAVETGIAEKLEKKQNRSAIFPRQDIYGNSVLTEWKWVSESDWLGEYAKARSDTRFINATQGGLGMAGIPNQDLKDVAKHYLRVSRDLEGKVHRIIAENSLKQISFEEIESALASLKKSLEREEEYLSEILKEIKRLEKKQSNQRLPLNSSQYDTLRNLNGKVCDEFSFKVILNAMTQVYGHISKRKLQGLSVEAKKGARRQVCLEKLRVNEETFAFLRKATQTNLEVLSNISKEMKARGYPITQLLDEEIKS